MNEEEILDNQNIEDLNTSIESEDFEQVTDDDIFDVLSKDEELGIVDLEETEAINELIEENSEKDVQENILGDDDFLDELAALDDTLLENEDLKSDDQNESTTEEFDEPLENGSVDETTDVTLEVPEIKEEVELKEDIEDETIQEINTDENIITNDLNNIKIEFGIEAKGFILSVNMMEAMIQKGYIFKDMLNDKVFDAVMIFNGNLENTVVTNDIKIKIENDKILLVRD